MSSFGLFDKSERRVGMLSDSRSDGYSVERVGIA